MMYFVAATLGLWGAVSLVAGEDPVRDWPQYAGPRSDRSTTEVVSLRSWPESGPPAAWKVPVNRGFSSFAVAGEQVYTLIEREGHETCVALTVSHGDERWSTALGASKYDGGGDAGTSDNGGGDGPRTTPSVSGERVFVYDAQLVLTCLDASDGEILWSRDVQQDFEGQSIRWQNAASPLIVDELVLVAGGGPGATFLAFEAETGEVAWESGDEKITHATPVVATLHGVRQVIFFVQSGLVSLLPETGEELWRAAYPFQVSTAASPVVHEDMVYCSAGYGVGGGTFRIHEDEGAFSAELLWQQRNKLQNHWSTPVCHEGYLYGMFSFKKYGEGPLMCVDMRTGETLWSVDGFGPGNVIRAGEDLIALSDAGEVCLVEATPLAYRELARAEVLRGKCWSSPALSDGQLYLRSTEEAVRLDLSPGS